MDLIKILSDKGRPIYSLAKIYKGGLPISHLTSHRHSLVRPALHLQTFKSSIQRATNFPESAFKFGIPNIIPGRFSNDVELD